MNALAGLHAYQCNFGTARIADNLTRTFRVSAKLESDWNRQRKEATAEFCQVRYLNGAV